jgi:hypothetical protein
MEVVKSIDFSYPYLEAKKAAQSMHDCVLEKQYDEALEHGLKAITELKLAYNAVLHEKEKTCG